MSKKEKKKYTLDPFQEWSHRFGRIGMVLFFIYMLMIPVIVLALLMLSFNLFADGLRDAFDPKMNR